MNITSGGAALLPSRVVGQRTASPIPVLVYCLSVLARAHHAPDETYMILLQCKSGSDFVCHRAGRGGICR